MIVYANLDQEAQWAGQTLPARVRRRIAGLSPLLAALADEPAEPAEPAEVWAAEPVDASRLRTVAGWTPPAMRVGRPARWDLAWADPAAQHVNDRRFALEVARELGVALPGARVIEALDQLDAHARGEWICKAPWTAAGRDRVRGSGGVYDRSKLARLLRIFGALVYEPWLDRVLDVGVCGRIGADGRVTIEPPHRLLTTAHGGFAGIFVPASTLDVANHDRLVEVVDGVGAALARAGYAGPFGVDAFVYRAGDQLALHPLCEINARYTFGHVARALARRLDVSELGFGPPPAGAIVLVAPTATEPVTAWVCRALSRA